MLDKLRPKTPNARDVRADLVKKMKEAGAPHVRPVIVSTYISKERNEDLYNELYSAFSTAEHDDDGRGLAAKIMAPIFMDTMNSRGICVEGWSCAYGYSLTDSDVTLSVTAHFPEAE